MSVENFSKGQSLEKNCKDEDNLSLSNFFSDKDEYLFKSTKKRFKRRGSVLKMYDFLDNLERVFIFFENEGFWDVEEGLKLKFFLIDEEIEQLLNENSNIVGTKSMEILEELDYLEK